MLVEGAVAETQDTGESVVGEDGEDGVDVGGGDVGMFSTGGGEEVFGGEVFFGGHEGGDDVGAGGGEGVGAGFGEDGVEAVEDVAVSFFGVFW